MKALLVLLVAGFLTVGASPALAVSGASGSGSAGIAQYFGPGSTAPGNEGGTLPQQEAGGNTPGQGSPGAGDEGDTLGREEAGGAEGDNAGVQVASVGDAGDSRLPFTGYSALLVLGVGVALLGTGIAVRSLRSRSFPA